MRFSVCIDIVFFDAGMAKFPTSGRPADATAATTRRIYGVDLVSVADGTALHLIVRGKPLSARVVPLPFVKGMAIRNWRWMLAAEAAERARRGEGPTLIECLTYRWYGHSHSDPRAYRTREEEAEWKERDPIQCWKERLLAEKRAGPADFEAIESEITGLVNEAVAFAKASPLPDPATLKEHVYCE